MNRLTVAALCLLSVSTFAADPDPIRLRAGETRVVDVGDYVRLAISNPEVAAVLASKEGGQLTLTGRNAGKTTLLVWQKKGGRVPYLIDVRGDPKPAELSVREGEQKTLKLEGLSRIAVGDPGIAEVALGEGSELRIEGRGQGRTTLMVWTKDGKRQEYEIAVAAAQANSSHPELKLMVGEKRHVEFHNVKRIALGDPEIVDVALGEKMSLDFTGKKEGKTTLIVWYGEDAARVDYEVSVTR